MSIKDILKEIKRITNNQYNLTSTNNFNNDKDFYDYHYNLLNRLKQEIPALIYARK